MAQYASDLRQDQIKITCQPPVHAFLHSPSFRLLKGQLWVLLGVRFQNPTRTAYSLHKAARSPVQDGLIEIDDGPDPTYPRDIPFDQYKAENTKDVLEDFTEQYPGRQEATLAQILNKSSTFVWMRPNDCNDANRAGTGLNRARTKNAAVNATKSKTQFSNHLGEILNLKPKDVRKMFCHRVWRPALHQQTRLFERLNDEVRSVMSWTLCNHASFKLLQKAAMKDMPNRVRLHAAVYFTGPPYIRPLSPLDYSTDIIPEILLLTSLRREEEERNPLFSYQTFSDRMPGPQRLNSRKRELSETFKKDEPDQKRPKQFVKPEQKVGVIELDDDRELVTEFWTKFCRGDFLSVYNLQQAMKRLGQHELQKLHFRQMNMLVESLNQSLGPGPILITAEDLILAVKQTANSSLDVHETLAFRKKFQACQFNWDRELLNPNDLSRNLVPDRDEPDFLVIHD